MYMKKISKIGLFFSLVGASIFFACKKEDTGSGDSLVPLNFVIDIPESISKVGNPGGQRTTATTATFDGAVQYESLRAYIGLGENSVQVMRKIMQVANDLLKNKISTLTFKSDDDGREKILVVTEKPYREGETWQYEMLLTDKASGNLALQCVWNKTSLKGIVVMDPDQLNYTDPTKDVMYRCDFEINPVGYDQSMFVQITNPLNANGLKCFDMQVYRKGDIVEVTGTSFHPTLKIDKNSTTEPGLCYAFVAKGDQKKNVGVAKVGFPFANVTTNSDLDKTYNLIWLYRESYKAGPDYAGQNDQQIDDFIIANGANLESPGYFKSSGLVSSGTNIPTDFSSDFASISNLKPTIPTKVRDLIISFLK